VRESFCETGKKIHQIHQLATGTVIFIAAPYVYSLWFAQIFYIVLLADFFTLIYAFLSSLGSFFILINTVIRQ
jgi:hypothetical protein